MEVNMSRKMKKVLVALAAVCTVCLLTLGVALASECVWCDEMANSLTFYKATYPVSNFNPYVEKVGVVRDAMSRGDKNTAKAEIEKLFQMLRTRAHGINDVAADELLSHWQMILPVEELKTSAPIEDCVTTATRIVCGALTINRIEDHKVYSPDNQDNMGGSEGG